MEEQVYHEHFYESLPVDLRHIPDDEVIVGDIDAWMEYNQLHADDVEAAYERREHAAKHMIDTGCISGDASVILSGDTPFIICDASLD